MTKLQQRFVERFTDQFIDWPKQKEDTPVHVINCWVSNIHEWWLHGSISLKDYSALLRVDILKV